MLFEDLFYMRTDWPYSAEFYDRPINLSFDKWYGKDLLTL